MVLHSEVKVGRCYRYNRGYYMVLRISHERVSALMAKDDETSSCIVNFKYTNFTDEHFVYETDNSVFASIMNGRSAPACYSYGDYERYGNCLILYSKEKC